jgi:hypothetical protein
MREPALDHGETWERFRASRLRRISELEVAMSSMTWWEFEEARSQLHLLWNEIQTAEEHIETDPENESVGGVQ